MDEKDKIDIRNIIDRNMDNLEETLNEKLKELLNEHGFKEQEHLITAREIFFKG